VPVARGSERLSPTEACRPSIALRERPEAAQEGALEVSAVTGIATIATSATVLRTGELRNGAIGDYAALGPESRRARGTSARATSGTAGPLARATAELGGPHHRESCVSADNRACQPTTARVSRQPHPSA